MSPDAIVVRNLAKRYALDVSPSDRLRQVAFPKSFRARREMWALRDVSFSVARGETLGIMGRNGCGKSTLLEIVAGTILQSSGSVEVEGRVAALLELGAGFDTELTGRENVSIYASLLGMTRKDVDREFDAILEFSGLGDFIDEPVRTYSTGMFVRLAFSVAVSAVPEVLLIDEALAVGDEAFQRRCFSRIEELKRQGVTLLFVSHSASMVLEICDRALLLDAGEMLLVDEPKAVVERYHRLIFAAPDQQEAIREEIRRYAQTEKSTTTTLDDENAARQAFASTVDSLEDERFDLGLVSKSAVEYVSRGARIWDVVIRNEAGEACNVLRRGTKYWYEYRVEFVETGIGIRFGMLFKTVTGVELGGIATHPVGRGIESVEAGRCLRVRIPFRASLAPGTYFANAGVVGIRDGTEVFLHRITDALQIRVALESNLLVSGAIDLSVEAEAQILDD